MGLCNKFLCYKSLTADPCVLHLSLDVCMLLCLSHYLGRQHLNCNICMENFSHYLNVWLLYQAGPYDNLKDVALKILENEVATVPIIHSSSEDGSFPQLLHLASLSGILKCKFFWLIYQLMAQELSLSNGSVILQVFAGILDILLTPCRYSNYQFLQFLLVHGFQKLEKPIKGHWPSCIQVLHLVRP